MNDVLFPNYLHPWVSTKAPALLRHEIYIPLSKCKSYWCSIIKLRLNVPGENRKTGHQRIKSLPISAIFCTLLSTKRVDCEHQWLYSFQNWKYENPIFNSIPQKRNETGVENGSNSPISGMSQKMHGTSSSFAKSPVISTISFSHSERYVTTVLFLYAS